MEIPEEILQAIGHKVNENGYIRLHWEDKYKGNDNKFSWYYMISNGCMYLSAFLVNGIVNHEWELIPVIALCDISWVDELPLLKNNS